ncbi:MAG: endonuclease V [Bacteroidales bacterium]|nr:endonuclease V [Bacteroidales bacterium]
MPPLPHALHDWNLTPKEAVARQRELAGHVDVRPPLGPYELVAGCDISYNRRSPILYAAVVVVRVPTLEVVEQSVVSMEVKFPYVPGLLSFREAPPIIAAWERLGCDPDVVMLDGQGIAHPRRFGLACHIGLWLDKPAFGCAKTRLVGEYDEPGLEMADTSPLRIGTEQVGVVLRSSRRAKPIFVSPGHKIDLASSIAVTLATLNGYRHAGPTRLAHIAANVGRTAGESPLHQPPSE